MENLINVKKKCMGGGSENPISVTLLAKKKKNRNTKNSNPGPLKRKKKN